MAAANEESVDGGPEMNTGQDVLPGTSSELTEAERDSPQPESSVDEDFSAWTSFPIVCVDKGAKPTERRIPAVKLTSVGGEWIIVPLALSELGALYDENHDFSGWDCYDIQGGWSGVQAGFRDLVEYPQSMLDRFLEVLRSGRFPGGEPLQFRNWSLACWGRDSPLRIEAKCCECKTIRSIVPRHLSALARDIAKFRCLDTGVPCVELTRLVPPKGKREAPSSVGYYVPGVAEKAVSDSSPSSTPQSTSESGREDAVIQEARQTITLQTQIHQRANPSAMKHERAERGPPFQGARTAMQGSRYVEVTPHPREFIVGLEATFFENADPTEEELVEFFAFRKTAEWRHFAKSLQRGGSDTPSFKLEGRDDVVQFRDWEKRIRYQFDSWVLTNPVTRAELAMTTFVYTAQDWWGAHRQRNPSLRVTFSQLCEWITTELVPSASHASALEAWTCLEYRGDLERYFKQLDDLRFYHYIDPCAAHSIAAKPFGTEFQARIRIMDKEAGLGGIAFPTLKELIRAHCAERRPVTHFDRVHDSRRRVDGARNAVPARAVAVEAKERFAGNPSSAAPRGNYPKGRITPPNSIPLPQRPTFETRDYFCLVCGDKNHIWPQCPKKQPRGCAACGSDAHLVRSCAQRRMEATTEPHRWDQTPETEDQKSQGWSLTRDDSADQKEGVVARRVGIYSSWSTWCRPSPTSSEDVDR